MATLAEIRAKLLEQDNKAKGNSRSFDASALFPHWNIPSDSSVLARFLPDGNDDNGFFWRERQMIKIPFTGVLGQDENKPIVVQVPCVEMWEGMKCPIHAEIRPWFNDTSTEDLARKYWKKRSYMFQGFIANDTSFVEDKLPENPIRKFTISPQIFTLVKAALMDVEFDELPTDFERGTDFKITKTQKGGGYADYSTSTWARKERGLTDEEREAIATHGLFDLNDSLPKQPSSEDLDIIFNMFEDSVEGKLYDPSKFAEFYRPWGMDNPNKGSSKASTPAASESKAPAPRKAPTPPVDKSDDEASTGSSASASSTADILAAIKNRKKA